MVINLQTWRNWQTRMVQVHVKAISCRFKSCYPHNSRNSRINTILEFLLHLKQWYCQDFVSKRITLSHNTNILLKQLIMNTPTNLSEYNKMIIFHSRKIMLLYLLSIIYICFCAYSRNFVNFTEFIDFFYNICYN